jgi:hypothetical protein
MSKKLIDECKWEISIFERPSVSNSLALIERVEELETMFETLFNITRCFCGELPEIESCEPCDDHPGNQFANWSTTVRCLHCKSHITPAVRFETKSRSIDNAIHAWNQMKENR